MLIDEEKMRKAAKSRMNTAKGTIPVLKFHKGNSAHADAIERARLIIGIFVAAAMILGSLALFWTLVSEGQKGVDTAVLKSQQRAPNAGDVQIILSPNSTK